MQTSGNLFGPIPKNLAEEHFEKLAEGEGLVVERIVSQGHASPAGFWYDQPRDEWVAVVSGEAVLRFEGEEPQRLRAGDWVLIPARRRHRVESTSAAEPTIWLAVHFKGML